MLKIIIFSLVPFLKKGKLAVHQKKKKKAFTVEMENVSLNGPFKHTSDPFEPFSNPLSPLMCLLKDL